MNRYQILYWPFSAIFTFLLSIIAFTGFGGIFAVFSSRIIGHLIVDTTIEINGLSRMKNIVVVRQQAYNRSTNRSVIGQVA